MAIAWWQWRAVQDRLVTFGQALVTPFGRRYQIRLRGGGQSFNLPAARLIQINCAMFPDEPPAVQFKVAQALLAHEAGHALFTDAWPERRENVLCQLVNALEDERIERAMLRIYPGVRGAVRTLSELALDKFLAAAKPAPPASPVLSLCLTWRWARRLKRPQRKLLAGLGVRGAAAALWRKVRPHVEAAWETSCTAEVIAEARQILDLLGVPPEQTSLPLPFGPGADLPSERSEPALDTPDDDAPVRQPPEVDAPETDAPAGDHALEPAPYLDLEEAARPLATQLAEALRLPEPDGHLQPHAYRGRYTYRQEARTLDTPCLARDLPTRAARSSAFYVLIDRSGSMDGVAAEVRLAVMMLLLAGEQLAVPVGCAVFGADQDDAISERVLSLAPLTPRLPEAAKALIAGYAGQTDCEFLDAGLALAEEAFASSSAARRVLVVIHDGQPVFPGDREASADHLRRLEDHGITPIGLYLGDDDDDLAGLQQLFRHLIACSPAELPERLGDLLRALVG